MAGRVRRDLLFNFIGDSSKLERASNRAGTSIDKVGTKTDRLGAKMNKFGKGLTAGVTLPIVAAFGVGLKSLAENEVLLAQTDAVIKSTGASAGVTSDEVLDLANSLSAMSGASHESIIEGENMLLTFTNIRNEVGEGNDVFDQATKTLLDMSVATGQDMKAAALQMGKALNDPIKGIAALSRVGVQFTKEQEEQIRTLTESGDVMEAQKIILAELETQFGGSAAAAGDTMTGKVNKMKNSFEELTRNLATLLLPVLSALTNILTGITSRFNNMSPAAQKVISVLLIVAATVGPVLIVGAKLISAFKAIKAAFLVVKLALAANPYILIIAATIAIVTLIIANWDKIKKTLLVIWDAIKKAASATWEFIKDAISKAIDFVKTLFLNFTGPGLLIKHWDKIKEGIQNVVDFFRDKWDAVIDFFTGIPGRISDAARGMFDGITKAFKGAVNAIIKGWNNLEFKIGGQHVGLPFGLGFDIPTITLKTPNIPTLHQAGVFRARTPGGEGLALLRDRERVSQESEFEPFGAPAASGAPTVIQLVVDREVLAEALIRHEEGIA